MADAKRDKITLKFNEYEAGQLNGLQYSYIYANSRLAEIPTVNQILRGMIQYVLFQTKDEDELLYFSNSFRKRRNLPPIRTEGKTGEVEIQSQEEITEEQERREQFRTEKDRPIQSLPSKETDFPRPGNFSFYTDNLDLDKIEAIKSGVANYAGISLGDITNAEVVRESIHFVFDHELHNHFFRYITYVGHLYDFTPLTSVIAGFLWRETDFPDKVVESALNSSSKDEFRRILAIEEDEAIFNGFQEEFNKHPRMNQFKDMDDVFGKYISKVADFDFLLAFVGMEITFYTMKYHIIDASESALVFLMNSKPSFVKIGVEMFWDYLEIFITLSKLLKEEGPPDYEKKIVKWVEE